MRTGKLLLSIIIIDFEKLTIKNKLNTYIYEFIKFYNQKYYKKTYKKIIFKNYLF